MTSRLIASVPECWSFVVYFSRFRIPHSVMSVLGSVLFIEGISCIKIVVFISAYIYFLFFFISTYIRFLYKYFFFHTNINFMGSFQSTRNRPIPSSPSPPNASFNFHSLFPWVFSSLLWSPALLEL